MDIYGEHALEYTGCILYEIQPVKKLFQRFSNYDFNMNLNNMKVSQNNLRMHICKYYSMKIFLNRLKCSKKS